MKINLNLPGSKYWPRCFYNKELRCGDPKTRGTGGPTDVALVDRGWHVADVCECPSCPLRCAIRDALYQYAEEV